MASVDFEALEDTRDIELSSLASIYPEIQRVRPDDPYTIALDIPVTPPEAVFVFFPAAAEANNQENAGVNGTNVAQVDSHELAHLPSLHLEMTFGPQYPAYKPPKIAVSTNPPWLPAETVRRLEDDGPRLWEEMGRDVVGFTYIDHVQQSAEDVFGLVSSGGALEVDPQHKITILDYDSRARRAAFERETFDCGVCLEPKKGTGCHRMLDCGHVFCVECLKDVYNNAIEEGNLTAVRCLFPNCAKKRADASGKKRRKPKTYISPGELLQIPLEIDMVKRYVTLKYKIELESDKNTIYCPRSWCNGAARSKKHKKPQGLELVEASDDEDDEEEDGKDKEKDGDGDGGDSKPESPAKTVGLLAICEDCGFAFCSQCFQSWHGEFFRCYPPGKGGLSAAEQASLDYLKFHTTPCPACEAPVQKTEGCNHMSCPRCETHFCYLCSAWLDPKNPYMHFNVAPGGAVTGCYMRLWELENGDGDDVGRGFAGRRARPADPAPARPPVDRPAVAAEEAAGQEDERFGEGAAPAAQGGRLREGEAREGGGQVGVAREGPLVLRIAAPPVRRGGEGPRGRVAAQPAGRGANHQPVAVGHEADGGGRGRAEAAAGGRGAGRAAGRGQRGRGAAAPLRQNNQRHQAHQQQQQHGGRGRRQANNQVDGNVDVPDVEAQGDGGLNAAQEAWIRQFVQLALNDEEDDIHFGLMD